MRRRTRRTFFWTALTLGGLSLTVAAGEAAPAPPWQPVTVFVVRHAEKAAEPKDNPPLTELGQRRATKLADMLDTAGLTRVFTSEWRRTQDTARLAAERAALTPEVVPAADSAGLAAKIVENPGGRVLVVGHSNTVGEILRALGAPPPPAIADNDYDNLYVVTVLEPGRAVVAHLQFQP